MRATCQPNVTEIGDWLRPYGPYGPKRKDKKLESYILASNVDTTTQFRVILNCIAIFLLCRSYDIADLCCWEQLQVCGSETAGAFTRMMSLCLRPSACYSAQNGASSQQQLSTFYIVILFGLITFLNHPVSVLLWLLLLNKISNDIVQFFIIVPEIYWYSKSMNEVNEFYILPLYLSIGFENKTF